LKSYDHHTRKLGAEQQRQDHYRGYRVDYRYFHFEVIRSMITFTSHIWYRFRAMALQAGVPLLFLLMISCSAKLDAKRGFDYRDGTKQGARYKPAMSPAEQRWVTVTALLIAFVVKK
jgi:hypothetical protein